MSCKLCTEIQHQVDGALRSGRKPRLGFNCPVCGRYWPRPREKTLIDKIMEIFEPRKRNGKVKVNL